MDKLSDNLKKIFLAGIGAVELLRSLPRKIFFKLSLSLSIIAFSPFQPAYGFVRLCALILRLLFCLTLSFYSSYYSYYSVVLSDSPEPYFSL